MRKDRSAFLAKVDAVKADITAALVTIAAKHGLEELKPAGLVYNDDDGRFELKVKALFAGGKTKEANLYEQLASFTPGLPPLGTVLKHPRLGEMTVIGSNTTGTKILVKQDGKTYLYGTEAIVKINGLQPANLLTDNHLKAVA